MAVMSGILRNHLHRPALAALLLGAFPSSVMSQEGGGVVMTFGVEQTLRWQDNPGLGTPAAGSEAQSRTGLSFSIVSETRTQRLALDTNATVVAGQASRTGLISPSAELSYRREAASSLLELTAFLSEKDVDTLEFEVDDPTASIPILTAVTGRGTQRLTGATAKLTFGQDAPFGGSVSLRSASTNYTGTSDPDLVDNRRDTARLSLRFDLTEVTTATAGLSVSRLAETGAADDRTETLSFGLEHALQTGSLTLDANATHGKNGTRYGLSFGRQMELPSGELKASLGLSWPVTGNMQMIGALDWRHDMPMGALSTRVSRSVANNVRDEETRVDRLDVTLEQALLPRLNGSLALGLQDSSNGASGLSTKTTRLDASLNYALTEDWGLRFAAQHRIRDTTGSGRAKSTTVSMTLSRSFEYLP